MPTDETTKVCIIKNEFLYGDMTYKLRNLLFKIHNDLVELLRKSNIRIS